MNISVIILSYNVKDLLRKAVKSVYDTYKDKGLQIIVVDNASSDGSSDMIKKEFPKAGLIKSNINLGFSAGNNLARKITKGNVVLFLNPDTEVGANTIKKCMSILEKDTDLAAVTCKVVLPNGEMDYSCHRGLPTAWNSFCYFSGLTNLFPKSKYFAGYSATYLNTSESHYIDCISGTFLMIKRKVLDKIGWWDQDYWWNGEDIEMCFRFKKAGYKIWYESSVRMKHFKGSSSGLWSTSKIDVPKKTKIKSARSAARAMRIFLEKHSGELGPWPLMVVVRFGIFVLEWYRLRKIEKGMIYKQ